MSKIDLSKFTFNGKQIQDISELVWEILREPGGPLSFVSVYDNIKVNTEVGFIGEGGLVGVKSTGCNPEAQEFRVGTRKVTWTPKDWEILIEMCYTEVEDTIAALGLNSGLNKPDLTNTDYMNIVIEALRKAMVHFLWRFIWFNDSTAKNVTGGGLITNGVDVKYFNIIDGLWKQIFAQATAKPAQRIIITENAGSTYAAQELDPDNARAFLYKMTFAAPLELRDLGDAVIYVTQSVYDAYTQSLSDSEKVAIESREEKFINGVPVLKCNGYRVIAMPEWDMNIRKYFDNGTSLNLPHRAIMTSKRVLGVGFDSASDFDKLDVWYNKDERMNKIEAMGNGDAKILHPDLFVVAY